MRAFSLAALLVASSVSSPAFAAPRTPTGKWVVDFHASQCFAHRSYGSPEQPLTLTLKAPARGDILQLAVVRRGKGGKYAEQREGTIQLDALAPVATTLISFKVPKTDHQVFRVNLPLQQFAGLRQAKALSIRSGRDLNESFALQQLDSVLKLLDDCTADLRTVWNVGTDAAPSQLTRGAVGNLQGLITSDDYPSIAFDRGGQGTVTFDLLVDEAGRVADCTVTESSGMAALDAQSCALVKQRAKFEPGIGLDGKPAKSSFTQRITWRME